MKILYKCKKHSWFYPQTEEKFEAYYLELNKEEMIDKIKSLLLGQNEQREKQLAHYGKIYVIVDKSMNYAIYVPHGGAHWPSSGHWDMSDLFKGMYGLEISCLEDLQHIEKTILEKSIEYLVNDIGIFGNLNDFNFSCNSHECFTSALVASYVYNYFISQRQYPFIPDKEAVYNFIVNGKRILVKTNAKKIMSNNTEYDWYENSCWKKNTEINKNGWDILYFIPITWNGKKYDLHGMYKIPYNGFHSNKALIGTILEKSAWFVPVDFDKFSDWLCKYKIKD